MRALKSILGSSLMHDRIQIRRERYTYVDLVGLLLAHLAGRLRAEAEAGAAVATDRVVLGRPVRFVDDDDAADRAAQDQLEAAARRHGFHHVEFQFEPVAAALDHEAAITRETLAFVADIGGGTSDFSVVRLAPPSRARRDADRDRDILAATGVHVGGTDFDRALSLAAVMPSFGLGTETADGKRQLPVWCFQDMATWHRINTLYTPKVRRDVHELTREAAEPERLHRYAHLLDARSGHRLAALVEAAKIELSDVDAAGVRLTEPPAPHDLRAAAGIANAASPRPGLDLDLAVSRATFEAATAGLVARIGAAIDGALAAAGIAADDVGTLIVTGGGAAVPAVRAAITSRLPTANVVPSDRFGAVGLGLAIDAARRFA